MTTQRNNTTQRSNTSQRNNSTRFKTSRSFTPKSSVVYIGNLPYDIGEKDLESLFNKFGRVKRVNLITNPGTTDSKGIAFITMLKQNDAKRAVKAYDGRVIKGRTIKCSEALERGDEARKAKRPSGNRAPKIDKSDINMIKKEKRKSSLNRMFDNIKR